MRIIFCGGGTAGHVTPAIAIAKYIEKTFKGSDILFIGRDGGMENQAITNAGFQLKTIKIKGLQRKINLSNIKNVCLAIGALKHARKIIKDFSPDVVMGTGGYVCWPVIRSAQKLKIPTAIHESNACPGIVTKLLAPKCKRVFLGISGAEKEFGSRENIIISGNPVREEFKTTDRDTARKRLGIGKGDFLISSFGGSGGSEKINEIIGKVMLEHSSKHRNIRHIHSCGNKYFEDMKKSFPTLTSQKDGCRIIPYIDDMPSVICASDIVISRCGAMTLTEICASGAAAILVPSPNVTNNHQYKNAKLICDSGAALLMEENRLTKEELIKALISLERDYKSRKTISEKIKLFHKENAEKIIADELIGLF